MENKKWNEIKEWMKKPATLLGLMLVAGVILCASLFSSLIVPQLKLLGTLNGQVEQLELQQQLVMRTPIPERATEEEATGLIKQIPAKEEVARLLLSLKKVESDTGVTIASLSFGAEKQKDLIAQLSSGTGETATSTPQAPAPPTAESTQQGEGQGMNPASFPIIAKQLNLQIEGTYKQIVQFVKQMQQMERTVSIETWQMQPGGQQSASSEQNGAVQSAEQTDNGQTMLQCTMSLDIYVAQAYANRFHELPPLPADKPGSRQDPTLTDEDFFDLLP